jgi:eukaryotic-like serine/threonine-protein kinase
MRTSGVADLAGRVLAGRYRLIAAIGTGASGRVYAGWDVRLHRRVAVKVLHAALAEDAGFLRRFGTEAQLAASLHHPHVVAVYDWGEDETPFMVLELLEGGSLRALLDAGARLSVAQAAAVGRQVAGALAYAHIRGLVHRDVKPANLLFDEHGAVRVADFGLARALAEASWTEPAGAVLGTARYAAPEQVRGVVDARSDVYSLALVLVEAVTGVVPFAGETSLASLLSRVERHLEAPPELGPLVPVLERAGRSDPAERWSNAADFAAALAEAASGLPEPEPLPLAGATVVEPDPHPTALPAPVGPPPDGRPAPLRPSRGREARRAPVRHRAPSRPVVPLVVFLLVALAAATAAFAVGRAAGPAARVPNVVGQSSDEARKEAVARGLLVRTEAVPAEDPAGTVVAQRPEPGTLLAAGRPVTLEVSAGPPPVGVPGVVGRSEADARAVLEAAGFQVSSTRHTDEEIPAGQVAAQEPAEGDEVDPGAQISLQVSDGPKPVVVPNVVGKDYDNASGALRARRLEVKRTDAYSDSMEAGKVISQDPVPGEEVLRGSTVKVVVSRGPDVVEVPDVRGEAVEDAVRILELAGLGVEDVVGYWPGKVVKRQDPSGGSKVRRGTPVTLFM